MLFLQECPSPGTRILLLRRGEYPGDAASGRGKAGKMSWGAGWVSPYVCLRVGSRRGGQ